QKTRSMTAATRPSAIPLRTPRFLGPPPAATLRMPPLSGSPAPEAVDEVALPGRVRYLVGLDASRWGIGLPTDGRVRDRDVYSRTRPLYHRRGRSSSPCRPARS